MAKSVIRRKTTKKFKQIRKSIRKFWKKKAKSEKIRPIRRSIAHLYKGNIRFAFYRYDNKAFSDYQNTTALLCYPRSGSHWVRFIVEWLSAKPTYGTGTISDIPLFLNTYPSKTHPLIHVDTKASFIMYKTHRAKRKLLKNNCSCILIIRNYRENVPRNHYTVIDGMREYCKLIAHYDQHTGHKMLIYYEDLLAEPNKEIRRIADFFNLDEKRHAAFMEQYDSLRELSYQGQYRSKLSYYKSHDDLNYRSKKMDAEQYQEREKCFKAVLAEPQYKSVLPYLKRYQSSVQDHR